MRWAFRNLVRFAWLFPAIAVLLFAASVAVHFHFLVGSAHQSLAGISQSTALADSAKRVFIAASIALSVAGASALAFAIYILLRARLKAEVLLGLVVFVIVWEIFVYMIDFGPALGGEYAPAVLNAIAENIASGGTVLWFSDVMSKIGALVIAFVVAALCVLSDRSGADIPRVMSRKLRDFQKLLYVTTTLLLTGMLFTYCMFRWSALITEPEQARDVAEIFSNGIVLAAGIFYSVLLVCAFVPVAVLQGRMVARLEQAALQKDPTLDINKWRADNQLNFSPLSALRTYFVMASPLITGAASYFAKGLLA